MKKILCFLILYSFLTPVLHAQLLPAEANFLNYRVIGFSFPLLPNTTKYKIQVADGHFETDTDFEKNIILTNDCNEGKVIAEVPYWGRQYTWRILCTSSDSKIVKGELHHFMTMIGPETDTNHVRLRIMQEAKKYKDAFVCVDGNKAIYDMKGKLVWFMRQRILAQDDVRDMNITPFGTLTFLDKENAYELNYNGDPVWRGPIEGSVSGDSAEHFHHELKRLSNGHYMIMGQESIVWKPQAADSTKPDSACHTIFSTLIEYDETGKVLWSWKSSEYFKRSDIFYNLPVSLSKERNDIVHANAFYFDQQANIVYVSFKTISRILKIKYPEATVVDAYGEIYKPGSITEKGNGLFCRQHAVKCAANGDLYMFNNNVCNNKPPTVLVLQQPQKKGDPLKKVWEYNCTVEDGNEKTCDYGGNVLELPDNSFFVSSGRPYCKMIIVGKDKKIAWAAMPERMDPAKQKWEIIPQYRAALVDRQSMEKFIWNTGK